MKKILARLKPYTNLLDIDSGLALFRHFGQLVYVKDEVMNEDAKRVIIDLSKNGLRKSKINSKVLSALDQNNLIMWIEEGKPSQKLKASKVKKIKKDDPIFSILSEIYNQENKVIEAIERIQDTSLNIYCDLQNHKVLFKELSALPFKNVNLTNGLTQALNVLGKSSPIVKNSEISVVVGSWNNTVYLRKLNSAFWMKKKSWLLVMFDFFGGQLGPFFSSKDSPCFECMLLRKQSFLDDREIDSHRLGAKALAQSFNQQSVNKLFAAPILSALCIELLKRSADLGSLEIQKGSYIFDSYNHISSYNELFAVDNCPICSDGLTIAIRPIALTSFDVLQSVQRLKKST